MRILLAEDDLRLSKMIAFLLKKENYIVDCVYDGEEAMSYIDLTYYDIAILDWMMPKHNGIEVCRFIRQKGCQTAVLMLTARDSLDDRIEGLDSGADDYLAKPFEFPELLARLRALARRVDKTFYSDEVRCGDLTLDCSGAVLSRGGVQVSLSPRECQLAELLLRNEGHILPREQVISRVWGFDAEINSNTLDVTMKSIRQKFARLHLAGCIKTIRGIGYKFSLQESNQK